MEHNELFHVEHFPDNVKHKFEQYKDLLLKWQKAINLVSRGTLDDVMVRHIEDSLQLISYVKGENLVDVGSGGGFPGMVLAIVGQDLEFLSRFGVKKTFNVTCVDSDARKMTFLSEVARQTNTKVNIITNRIEKVQYKFDTVTARGFAELKTLIGIAKTLSNYGVFLKGKKIDQEIAEACKFFKFDYEIFNSVTDKSGRIIVVSNISDV